MDVNFINAYLESAGEVVGERSPEEKAFDDEVVAGLDKGLAIKAAINAANAKFPSESLKIDKSNEDDVLEHYTYLAEHKRILRRLGVAE